MELGKEGAIFDRKMGRNSAPRERQMFIIVLYCKVCCTLFNWIGTKYVKSCACRYSEFFFFILQKETHQKLIYSGKLLADHMTLKEVLRQVIIDRNTIFTVLIFILMSGSRVGTAGPYPLENLRWL